MTSPSSRIEPHVWRIAIVVILGAIMSVLDTTIVNVALQTLSRGLHTSLGGIPGGLRRVPAPAPRGDPRPRLAPPPFRRPPRLHRLDRPLHPRLAAVGPRVVG